MRDMFLCQYIWLLSLQIIHPTISFEGPGLPRDLSYDPLHIPAVANKYPIHPDDANSYPIHPEAANYYPIHPDTANNYPSHPETADDYPIHPDAAYRYPISHQAANEYPIHPEAANEHLLRQQPRPESSAQLEDGRRPPKRQRSSLDQPAATPIANTHEAFSRELDVGHHPRNVAFSHDVEDKYPAQDSPLASESNHSGPERFTPPSSTEDAGGASHDQSTLAHTGAERSSQPLTTTIQDLGTIPAVFPNLERPPYIPVPHKTAQKFTDNLMEISTRHAALADGAVVHRVREIDHLPADIVTYFGKPDKRGRRKQMTLIRILDSEYNYLSPEKMASKLGGLFNYMTFNHALLLSHLGPIKQQKRLTECAQLLKWLGSQLEGPEDSLPVIGKVHITRISQGFGEAQRWIIWYLHHEDQRAYAYTTSIALLWFWYRACEPEKLQQLENKRQELGLDSFWSLMRHYGAKPGPGAGWCKVKSFDEQRPLPSSLGRIGITSLHESTRSYNKWAMKFTNYPQGAVDEKIVEKIRQAYDGYTLVPQPGHTLKRFYATSALLHPCQNILGLPAFAVRLTDKFGGLIPIFVLEVRLRNLLESCHWWHQNLSQGLVAHGITPIQGAHQMFLAWLSGILFQGKHSLPVFGIVHQSTYDMFVGHPGFAHVQRFLIHCLSFNPSPDQPSTAASNTITLLAYWYSSQQADFWLRYVHYQDRFVMFIKDGLKQYFDL